MDWYEIEFRDETSEDYLADGQWVHPIISSEYITTKGGREKEVRSIFSGRI
ncbi:MAG: hypothetical protein IPL83_00080 [Bdellovibrionales bacterium]|nr:hypothetical protein [Bdellovibrionales bacterium]